MAENFYLEEGQERGPEELQATQLHLKPWEGGGSWKPFPTQVKDKKVIRSC